MHLIISTVTFSGYTLFESNYAFQLGGGIAALVKSKFLFSAITKFIRGCCKKRFRWCYCNRCIYEIGNA